MSHATGHNTRHVYRVQCADGRGPYKPGFSRVWADDFGPPPPPTWMAEFPRLLQRMDARFLTHPHEHYGSAVARIDLIHRWFTLTELQRLQVLGYRLVRMDVNLVLAESANQLVFARAKPLNVDIEIIDFERISSGSAPQIQNVRGYAGEHAECERSAQTPSPGHGTAGDQCVTRAATDALAEGIA